MWSIVITVHLQSSTTSVKSGIKHHNPNPWLHLLPCLILLFFSNNFGVTLSKLDRNTTRLVIKIICDILCIWKFIMTARLLNHYSFVQYLNLTSKYRYVQNFIGDVKYEQVAIMYDASFLYFKNKTWSSTENIGNRKMCLWSEVPGCCFCELAILKIQLIMLVQYKISPWYGLKIVHLALFNNHSLNNCNCLHFRMEKNLLHPGNYEWRDDF